MKNSNLAVKDGDILLRENGIFNLVDPWSPKLEASVCMTSSTLTFYPVASAVCLSHTWAVARTCHCVYTCANCLSF